ncbi:LuxR C-terminal-related transcriptional regulator [Tsukamurella sp. NPDC003166]|uniref:helix-turn-helix transcriptional regulator n=1 Tax=Tsukamurella sp. NPDC003166 TaxID=3154444 RepID=UPI0033A57E99
MKVEQDSGGPSELLAEAVRSGDPERIAAVATQHIWPLFNTAHAALLAAISPLPGATIGRYPVLQLVHPLAPVFARSTRPFTVHALNRYRRAGYEESLVLTMQMIGSRMSGDIGTALGYAHQLVARLRTEGPFDVPAADDPSWFFRHQIGTTHLMAGQTVAALREFGTARQIGEVIGSADAVRSAAGRAALTHAVRGAVDDAQRALDTATALPHPGPAYADAALGTERTAAALIDIARMRPERDRSVALLEALDTADVVWPFVMYARASHALADGRAGDALDAIAMSTVSHDVRAGTFASDAASALRITAHLALGEVNAARRALETATVHGTLTRVAEIRLALHEADPIRAHARQVALTAAELSPAQWAEVTLLAAWRESLAGEVSDELAHRTADLAASPGNRRAFTGVPATVIDAVLDRLPESARASFTARIDGLPLGAPPTPRPRLTPREYQVLRALIDHDNRADMAAALGVSTNTVKTQLRSLYRKLGATSKNEALTSAARLALLPSGR